MWPSAVALSRWIMTNPQEVIGRDVLELGAGKPRLVFQVLKRKPC